MEQVCTSCLLPLPTLGHLSIFENPRWRQHWQGNVENALWPELLYPFTYVKNLYLSEHIAKRIVPALHELVGGRATEVFARPTEYFVGGAPAIGTCRGGHSVDRFRATGHRSTHSSFLRTGVSILVNGRLGSH
jgi:hypothetical protein